MSGLAKAAVEPNSLPLVRFPQRADAAAITGEGNLRAISGLMHQILFDYLVGAPEQRGRNFYAERLRCG
jgi:hypothetical protein